MLVSVTRQVSRNVPEGPDGFRGGLTTGEYSAITGALPGTNMTQLTRNEGRGIAEQ